MVPGWKRVKKSLSWMTLAALLICHSGSSAQTGVISAKAQLANGQWKVAAREIFLQAKAADKNEWSIPTGQARAGYLDDALTSIADLHVNTQSAALLKLLEEVSSIDAKKRLLLLDKALEKARSRSGASRNYLKSGDLARAALYLAKLGMESEAKAVFVEASAAAKQGLSEEGSGAYQALAGAMRYSAQAVPAWMFSEVSRSLDELGAHSSSASAYLDLAEAAGNQKNDELAKRFLEKALTSTSAIQKESVRNSTLNQIARLKWTPNLRQVFKWDTVQRNG